MNAILERIKEIFGGAQPLGASPSTTDEWRVLVEHGIPASALHALSRLVGNDEDQTRKVVSIVLGSNESVDGKLPHERLSGSESERAERVARMFALAESVLGDQREAGIFLFSPHPKLDGSLPVDWIRTELGGREVEQLLR